jgi:hypothetical protein
MENLPELEWLVWTILAVITVAAWLWLGRKAWDVPDDLS